ncbi:MAG: hypothetical protein AAF757_22425 [Cyanobacteria bacterium P01_D01_bin.116]
MDIARWGVLVARLDNWKEKYIEAIELICDRNRPSEELLKTAEPALGTSNKKKNQSRKVSRGSRGSKGSRGRRNLIIVLHARIE